MSGNEGQENPAFSELPSYDTDNTEPEKSHTDNEETSPGSQTTARGDLEMGDSEITEGESETAVDDSESDGGSLQHVIHRDENTSDTNDNKIKSAENLKKKKELLRKLETFRTEYQSIFGKSKTCYDIHKFVILYCVLLVLRTCISSYSYAVSSEIWQRYYITKLEMEFVSGVEKIGFVITLIFSSFYGNKFYKPVSILIGNVICGVGAILCATPYFIRGGRQADNDATVPTYIQAGLCLSGSVVKNQTFVDQCNQHPAMNSPSENVGAYSLLCTGHFFMGIGTAFLIPAGIVYTDEAEPVDKMPLFLGLMLSSYGIGNIIGSLIGYWLVIYPENLSGSILLHRWHIGAWWVGFVLFGGLLILVSFLLLFFPRWIREPKWLLFRKYRNQLKLERWKKREEEARRRRRKKKREKLRKERERKNIKNRAAQAAASQANQDDSGANVGAKAGSKDEGTSEQNAVQESKPQNSNIEHSAHSSSENGAVDKVKTARDNSSKTKHTKSSSKSAAIENGKASGDSKTTHYRRKGSSTSGASPKKDRVQTAAIEETGVSDNTGGEQEPTDKKKSADEKNKQRYKLGRKLQDLPKNLWFLLTRPVFIVTTVGAALSLYLQAGYFLTLHNYIQKQFQYSQRDSAIIPCAVFGIGIIIGCISSSVFLYKVKLSLNKQLKICLMIQGGVVIGLLVLMALGCSVEHTEVVKDGDVIKSVCASECDCSVAQLYRVCDRTGSTVYHSPCHAGCTDAQVDPVTITVHYKSCSCSESGDLAPQWCETPCSMAAAFVVILLLVVSLQSSAYVTVILILLIALPEKLRSITLGFSWWLIYLIAFVPGVAIYNAFYMTSCTMDDLNCQDETVCWLHDSAKYRYISHGTTIGFVFTGILVLVGSYFVMVKCKHEYVPQKGSAGSKKEIELKQVDGKNEGNVSGSVANGVDNVGYVNKESTDLTSV